MNALSRRLLALALVASSILAVACGASSPAPEADDAGAGPPIYWASDPGFTTFSWRRSHCVTHETGCIETGAYSFDSAGENVTFTTPQGLSVTFPFASMPPASGQSAGLHTAGSTLTTGSGESLTGTPATLGNTFQMGNQSFAAGPTLSTSGGADGGVTLAKPTSSSWLPPVVNQQGTITGGAVLAPHVVSISWSSDPQAATWEGFVDALAGSSYWTATTTEYGIGALTSSHVRLTSKPPTNLTTETLAMWITSQISAKGSPWPTPTSNTYYALFLPTSTSAAYKEQGQKGCGSFDGEHDSTTYKGTPFAYAIMLQCSGGGGADEVTSTAAHELVEGSADPFSNTKPTYIGFDAAHLAWDLLQNFQDEIADACEDFPSIDAHITANGKTYAAQRTWSNAAAAQGHDPCVPAPSGVPYFTVTPLDMTMVTINTPSAYINPNPRGSTPKTLSGLGYSIKAGTSQTVQLQLTSDQPGGTFQVTAMEGAPDNFDGAPQSSRLSLSQKSWNGQAGTMISLTIKVKAASKSGELVTFAATQNGITHWTPILIAN
jgi:hypothetical protein